LHKNAQGKPQNGILDSIITPKVVSKPDPATGLFNPFPSFNYTGPLRPVYPLSEKRTVPKSIPHPDYAETGFPRSERFVNRNKFDILDAKAQDAMRKVCKLGREVLDIVAAEIRPGVTTDYLDEICHKATVERKVSLPQRHRNREGRTESFGKGVSRTLADLMFSLTRRRLTTTIFPSHSAPRSTRSFATVSRISGCFWTVISSI
jgi:hypothetical protein